MVGCAVVAAVGRELIVTLYGDDYREAADIVPLLVAAAIPWAVTSVYLTEARVRHRHAATVAITLALSAAILIPALVVVPAHGLAGASWAFLGGNAAAAAVPPVPPTIRPAPHPDDAITDAPLCGNK